MPAALSPTEKLSTALRTLADTIERNPPTIIGSLIHVHGGAGAGEVVGQSIMIGGSGSAGGSLIGEHIVVTAVPGQSVIGKSIVVTLGDETPPQISSGARSLQEITDAVAELREMADTLRTSPPPRTTLNRLLTVVTSWGSAALNGACSGVAQALAEFAVKGG